MMKIKTVYAENYGCTSNMFDFEIMITSLDEAGYQLVDDLESADVFMVNTCGVKKATEDKILGRLCFLRCFKKPIIITGCLPKIDFAALRSTLPEYAAMLDPYSIDRILLAVKGIERGERNQLLFAKGPVDKLKMPKMKSKKIVDIVQISEGCLGACAFCCTKFARGRLYSYPSVTIVDRIEEAVGKGVKEFWITAQDTGSYGIDIKSNLAELLRDVCSVEGAFYVRVGMMEPSHVLNFLDSLLGAYKHDKIFKFLHLPLQSGNDSVLKSMNRLYDVNDFSRIVYSFRKEIPDLTLSTDIICGFPTEDENAFNDSLEIIKKLKPDIVNVSKFFPRPGTPAMKLKQLPNRVVKLRSERMSELCRAVSLKKNLSWFNWVGDIFVDEMGKDESWVGRNFAYKPIVIDDKEDLLGKTLKICVKEAYTTYLKGEEVT